MKDPASTPCLKQVHIKLDLGHHMHPTLHTHKIWEKGEKGEAEMGRQIQDRETAEEAGKKRGGEREGEATEKAVHEKLGQ